MGTRAKWNREAVSKAGINQEDARFLCENGMPNLESFGLVFMPDEIVPAWTGTDLHTIGLWEILNDVPLFVRESISGVWTVEEATKSIHLINSSAMTLSQFITLFEKMGGLEKLLPKKFQEPFVTFIKDAMKEIDPYAFEVGCLWEPFMEDMENYAG